MTPYVALFLLGCIMYATAFPEPSPVYNPSNPANRESEPKFIRLRRFTEGGITFGQNPQQQPPKPTWEVKPDLSRDGQGNTNAKLDVQNHGQNHDFGARYEQTIKGPAKHSETWKVGGRYRW